MQEPTFEGFDVDSSECRAALMARYANENLLTNMAAIILNFDDIEFEKRIAESDDPRGTWEAFAEAEDLYEDQVGRLRDAAEVYDDCRRRIQIVLTRVAALPAITEGGRAS